MKYINGQIKSLTLKIKNKHRLIAFLGIELPNIPVTNRVNTFLGIDRGINRVVVLSNNRFYNMNHIKAVRWKYQWLRKHLQQKGTRSAKRKLKRISGREQRFMKDVNHQIANWIVSQP
ncbi:MAG: transposase [Promethearchaeota archaeon]